MAADDWHRQDHIRAPLQAREQIQLARLWRLRKGDALRIAALYAHALGFELKIVDELGDFVYTQVHRTEPAAIADAAARHGGYRDKGWYTLEDHEPA